MRLPRPPHNGEAPTRGELAAVAARLMWVQPPQPGMAGGWAVPDAIVRDLLALAEVEGQETWAPTAGICSTQYIRTVQEAVPTDTRGHAGGGGGRYGARTESTGDWGLIVGDY